MQHQIKPVEIAALKGVFKWVHKRTVPIFERRQSGPVISTGVLVQIGKRLLIVTTAHSIVADKTKVIVCGFKEVVVSGGTLDILSHHRRNWRKEPDVGVMELDASMALGYLKKEPLTLDSLSALGPAPKAGGVNVLCGYPRDLVQVSDDEFRDIDARALCCAIRVMPVDEWPGDVGTDPPSSADSDIFLNFDLRTAMFHFETGEMHPLPKPYGLSGCGFWHVDSSPGQLWSPDTSLLCGIQSRWYENHEALRVMQIVEWLKLVAESYPDVRNEICDKFPEAKSTRPRPSNRSPIE